jgi:hypothetical protein
MDSGITGNICEFLGILEITKVNLKQSKTSLILLGNRNQTLRFP